MTGNIPSLIADSLVKINGTTPIGLSSYTLPEINFKSESMEGLGVGRRKEASRNDVEEMTLPLKIRGVDEDALAMISSGTINLVLAAAIQKIEKEVIGYTTVIATVSGSVTSFKPGEIAKGGKFEPEIELAIDYYKLEVNGKVINEIDQSNNIVIFNGNDITGAIKSILGG